MSESVDAKVSEIYGPALDWATAKAMGLQAELGLECCGFGIQTSAGSPPECCNEPLNSVFVDGRKYHPADTEPGVVACRILVANAFGDFVNIPSELLP